ncbi:MAG: DUF6119 family protein [Chitinophagales bacterium]
MNQKFHIKVFKIKESHYLLRDKSFEESVQIIIENHKKHIYAGVDDIDTFNIQFEEGEVEDFKFASYCYNQPEERHYWRLFLPDYIGQDQNFSIIKFSYVLFTSYNNSIYCVIGGSGIGVIKTFINPTFGIDVYSRIAKPAEDLVIEIKSRSIANNVSLQTTTYNYNQTVADTIEFSEIPAVMKIVVRDELKNGFFSDFGLDINQAILEVGSYFCLRKMISFDDLLQLIKLLDNLIKNVEAVDLSFFKKIENEELIELLDTKLISSIIEDVKQFSYQNLDMVDRRDIDIVHPTKLENFYECDKYIVRFKNSRGSTDKLIENRQKLYIASIEHIYNRLEGDFEDFNIKNEIYKNQIRGVRNHEEITYGTFLNHIVAELTDQNKRYFKIDREWYHIKDVFLQKLTDSAIDKYQRYKLEDNLLKQWRGSISEGEYNQQQDGVNSYNLDKLLIDNIELCDVLQIRDDKLYFIHVKDGFDVKLRDCYIQVVLAAKRLNIDLSDNTGENYLIPTLTEYNSQSPTNQINIPEIVDHLIDGSIQVIFVLAYRNKTKYQGTAIEKIRESKSNIAKYSIVNVVKEMNEIYDLKLIDISTISDDS